MHLRSSYIIGRQWARYASLLALTANATSLRNKTAKFQHTSPNRIFDAFLDNFTTDGLVAR
jgi:hypothetical protein